MRETPSSPRQVPPVQEAQTRNTVTPTGSPRLGRKPAVWTRVDRDYETLRIGMQTPFDDLGITPTAAATA